MIKRLIVFGLLLAGLASAYTIVEAQTPPEITSRFGLSPDAVELEFRREANSKVFLRPNGEGTIIFQRDLHYQRPDGRWAEPVLQFGAARTAATLAFPMGSDLVITGSTAKSITWVLPVSPTKIDGNLVYQDRGITWTYKKLNSGVKLEGVVSSSRGRQTYAFPYRVSSPLAIDRNGEVEGDGFRIPHPLIIDANGKKLAPDWVLGNGQLEVTFDDSGLALPYTIDPTTNFDIVSAADDVYTVASDALFD